MVKKTKIENLISVLVIAFCWAYLAGIRRNSTDPIRLKSHGRKSQNIFRYGYDTLRQTVLRGPEFLCCYFSFLLPDSEGVAHV